MGPISLGIVIYCINYKRRVQPLSIMFDHKPAYFVGKIYQTFGNENIRLDILAFQWHKYLFRS